MKTMHLFAGIGGGLLSDLINGHEPIIAVEWDGYACSVLRERVADGWFPNMQVYEGDVRLFDPSEYAERVDCIHAGFPCQDISNAGKRAGVGEETRSGLYLEVIRIADVVRPKYIFMENVSAILSNGLGTVLGDLAARGYDARWICLRASDVGANHQRDRWWLLARNANSINDTTEQRVRGGKVANSIGIRKECAEVAYNNSAQQQREQQPIGSIAQHSDIGAYGWWETEPELGRLADGVSNRVGQLKGYGNAQVPLQAAVAFKILMEME